MPDQEVRLNELEDALNAFEATLKRTLEAEAHRSIDEYLKTLETTTGYSVEASRVTVNVAGLRVSAVGTAPGEPDAAPSTSPRRSPAKKPRAKTKITKKATGRPNSAARTAVRDVLASDAARTFKLDEVRAGLEERGVQVTTTNLHQLLRRLSTAGDIERVGRGEYRITRGDVAA